MLSEYQTVKTREARHVPQELSSDNVDLLTQEICSGEALLRVVVYPWGVEFDVCEFAKS